ncbi:hypothetical protein C8R44DRAFT_981991 [Mycena epipterygia]|nr:hypothetical protein C8R44DRAFT_981991 [Mycena epipterygia]
MDLDGIAIVGLAAQLPSGSSSSADLNYASFWDFLVSGGTAYEPLKDFVQTDTQVNLPAQGTFLKNATSFDNISLGISTRDARLIPHSGRRLLDLSFQALLDSGIDSRGRNIGCFMSGNRPLQTENPIDPDGSASSWMPHSMANRISYALDLTGPSIYLDTACSSSLTALHLAIGAIERGDCAAALVGAAQINRDPFEWAAYAHAGGILSSDGVCRPFDAAAGGFGRGEGAVVIVLKPLKDAIKDHDHIYSVASDLKSMPGACLSSSLQVLGSYINTTGSRLPPNVPNGVAQQKCIYEAYRRAGLDPKDADYVELHATGTPVGDPIEANTAGKIFATDRSVVFGSVKGNIGHLEVTAFLASLVKACLIFKHAVIPPTVNFSNPADTIDWAAFQILVPVEPLPLGCRSSSERSIISLSGFALGGATGHVVLQAPPVIPDQSTTEMGTAPILFLVGGLSSNVVDQISRAVLEMATDDVKTLRECAVTLSRRARQLPWRKYFTVPLSPRAAIPAAGLIPREPFPLAFVFSGQGPQHLEMGRQLFAAYPVFRKTIIELDDVYRRVKGTSLLESTGLFAPAKSPPAITLPDFGWPVVVTLSAIAMVQIAMFDLLQSVGVRPDVMLGHSAGESATLYASGAGSKAMAMEIAIARGEAMTSAEGEKVGMAVVACRAERAQELIARVITDGTGGLEISCYNAPESITVSGTASLLDQLVVLAKREDIFAQRLRTMVPVHSSFMDCIKEDYMAKMDDIFTRYPGSHAPRIPVYSTCRAERLVEAFTPSYFWDNCRNAVLFSKAVSDLLPSSPVFLEISCHAVLSSSILARGVPDGRVLCPMRRISAKKVATSEPEIFLDTLGRLSLLGLNSIDLSDLYGPSEYKPTFIEHPLVVRDIPPPKSLSPRRLHSSTDTNGPLSSSNLLINKLSHPNLAEHVINGQPTLPATAFIELLLEAGANFLWDVEFKSSISIPATAPLEIRLQRLDAAWSVRTDVEANQEQEHARGFMDTSPPNEVPPVMDCENILKHLPSLDVDGFYPSLKPLAAYGPQFQRVVRCHGGPSEVIAEIEGPTPEELSEGYLLHPAIVDACIHVLHHTDISKQYSKDIIYLPTQVDHFNFYRRNYGPGNWFSHIRLREWTPDARYYDILITDSSGLALCEFRNLKVQKFTWAAPITVGRRFDLIFQPVAANAHIPALPIFFPERTDKREIKLLYETLDSLAVAIISTSLEHDLVLGEEGSRRRYLHFARRAAKKSQDINLAPEVLQDLRDKWPYHFEITNRIAAVHKSVFETSQGAVDALYSDDLMTKYYSKRSQTSNVCSEVTKTFSSILESLQTSGKKSITILEVGAGTGLLTSYLIDEIKQHHELLVQYTLTDISYTLVADLARKISYESIIPKAYDISKDAHAQGIPVETYDVVVALHALHQAPSVQLCLASLQNLLVPGGCLLAVELDGTAWSDNPGSLWTDFVFGSSPEWFGYVDERDHCTMPPTGWKDQLEVAGFNNVQTCVETGGSGREFFFMAQKSLSDPTPSSDPPIDLNHIYSYEFGKEIHLQQQLKDLDPTIPNTVYLLTMVGRDADAAIGLCAALRQEIPLWDIRLAIFESWMDLSNPTPFLIRHMGTFNSGENVVYFDQDGVAHIMRVALSPSPSTKEQGATEAVDDPSHINVRITHWAGMSALYDGFVGQVVRSHHRSFSVGDFVGGVVEPSSAEFLRVHIDHIILTTENPRVDFAGQVLGTLVSSLVSWPSPGVKTRLAIALENKNLTQIIRLHASNNPKIQLVLTDFRDRDISERLDILVSDSATYAEHHHLHRWIPRSGKVLLWDELLKEAIGDDPSYIHRILENILQDRSEIPRLQNGHVLPSIPRDSWVQPSRSSAAPLFHGDRAYVLLGGIGGLGIDLAVWMYQHGARHLVLTSRRGLESLDPIKDAMAMAKGSYLKSQDDLDLRLDKCDATDVNQMNVLLHSLPAPIAGCFHLAMVLSDALFFNQTCDTFHQVYDSKLKIFEIVSTQVEIESLDFFVALSSISGLIGLPGQSNYASACTALDGILARYPNAFSLIAPGILDAGYIDRTNSKHIVKDGLSMISAEALWVYLADGLRKLDECPFNQYIPDLDWNSVDQHFNLSVSCRHLLSPNSSYPVVPKSQPHKGEGILPRVLELLEVSLLDFDATQPLTVYGLDSISAAKLAAILRPYASFSQLQLLGTVTWSEIESQLQYSSQTGTLEGQERNSGKAVLLDILNISQQDFSPDIPLSSYGLDLAGASRLATALRPFMDVTAQQLMSDRSWADLLQITKLSRTLPAPDAQPLVEICGGDGIPVIILPGGNGVIGVLFGLQEHFHGALWAIQVTDSTPLESMETLVTFWKQHICEKWPHGPYRFAGYSSASVLGVVLTKMMEDAGEEVAQLTFLDHFPMLWARLESDLLRERTAAEILDLVDQLGYSILEMLRNDPTIGPKIVENYQAALLDLPDASPHNRLMVKNWRAFTPLLWNFLRQFRPTNGEKSHNSFIELLNAWMSSVKAPMVLIVAEYGVVDGTLGGWPDLGASRISKPVKVHYLSGVGHFGIFGDERVARILAP